MPARPNEPTTSARVTINAWPLRFDGCRSSRNVPSAATTAKPELDAHLGAKVENIPVVATHQIVANARKRAAASGNMAAGGAAKVARVLPFRHVSAHVEQARVPALTARCVRDV